MRMSERSTINQEAWQTYKLEVYNNEPYFTMFVGAMLMWLLQRSEIKNRQIDAAMFSILFLVQGC